jgi:hypothetical protein
MRTTLDIESDVLNLAKSLADAQRISVGKALSYLARKGATARAPVHMRNGFPVFAVPDSQMADSAIKFGPADVQAALDAEDEAYGRFFLSPVPPA